MKLKNTPWLGWGGWGGGGQGESDSFLREDLNPQGNLLSHRTLWYFLSSEFPKHTASEMEETGFIK